MEDCDFPGCHYQALAGSSPEPSPIAFPPLHFPEEEEEEEVSIPIPIPIPIPHPQSGDLGGTSQMPAGAGKQADWDRLKYSKKQAAIANGIWGSIMLVLIGIIIFLAGKPPAIKIPAVPGSSDASSASSCPPEWKENEGKCYFFSDVEGNWTFSQNNCSSYGASLVTLDSQKEMDYVKVTIGHKLHWIGIKRENVREPWRWTNGSLFNNWFPIRLDGLCAYLAKDSVRSTSCFVIRFWICSKIVSGFP